MSAADFIDSVYVGAATGFALGVILIHVISSFA